MFTQSFHQHIKWKRHTLGVSQANLAAQVRISRARLSAIENGRRRPNSYERLQLTEHLALHPSRHRKLRVRPLGFMRKLLDAGRQKSPDLKPYFPPQDRSNYLRYKSAQRAFGPIVHKLTSRIIMRPDAELAAEWGERVASGSADECLYLLSQLAAGGQPTLMSPYRLGHLPKPVVCPVQIRLVGHRPIPCLVTGNRYEFFQVSLAAPRIYTVDVLCYEDGWGLLEIDGAGHDSRYDHQRTLALGLPVHRLSTKDVLEHALEVCRRPPETD